MKRIKKLKYYFIFFLILLLLPLNELFRKNYPTQIIPIKASTPDSIWVAKQISEMTLEEKCAQMIFPHAQTVKINPNDERYKRLLYLVKELKVGGFIFFKGQAETQIDLINELQTEAEIPLLMCADYERGAGIRLEDATEFPHNMAVGAVNDPYITFQMGKAVAAEGLAAGIQLNFAPLLDINNDYRNPVIDIRSYSENPVDVSILSSAYINGMKNGGMFSTVKHFPGHGATNLDSHTHLPIINRSYFNLVNNELLPYRESIKAEVEAVMPGHLLVPALEDNEKLPATLSPEITTELLKNKMGFGGLVVTDAMNMRAITNLYSDSEAAKLAVIAGNDVILFPDDEWSALQGIINAVKAGEIEEERIDESVKKILLFKRVQGLDKNRITDKSKSLKILKNKKHKRLAASIARKAITLIKDEKYLLPVNPDYYKNTVCIGISDGKFDEIPLFQEEIKKQFKNFKNYNIYAQDKIKRFNRALKAAEKADLIILPLYIYSYSLNKKTEYLHNLTLLINRILELEKPVIVISFGTPYLITELPKIETYLCAYGETEIMQKAMIDALLGYAPITGKLPVSIPGEGYVRGYGQHKSQKFILTPELGEDQNYNFYSVDSLMQNGIDKGVFPGGVLTIYHRGKGIYHKAFGKYSYTQNAPKMKKETIFDLASLTKVVATTTAAMKLFELGKLELDKPVKDYLPEFSDSLKTKVTIRNLLNHTSGLPAFMPFYKSCKSKDEVIEKIFEVELKFKPGTQYLYSDLGMVLLQQVIEKITNSSLDEFLKDHIFEKLEMNNTFFNPPAKLKEKCAPTEYDFYWRNKTIQGEVHDETASMLNGVAGNAGLFSTAEDLSKFLSIYLNRGHYRGEQIFREETLKTWTSNKDNLNSRALGWDTNIDKKSSCGNLFSKKSFGHTGFTGTSLWVDPEEELFVILLTNRVHPSRHNTKIIKFRKILHNEIYNTITF